MFKTDATTSIIQQLVNNSSNEQKPTDCPSKPYIYALIHNHNESCPSNKTIKLNKNISINTLVYIVTFGASRVSIQAIFAI